MLGTALKEAFAERNAETLQLVRRLSTVAGQIQWNPTASDPIADPKVLEGLSGVIHLSGASVAGHRWTSAWKREIWTSRVESTRVLATSLARLRRPPRVLLVASATGIYGNRGDELLDETSAPGRGFLANVCEEWEAAAQPAVKSRHSRRPSPPWRRARPRPGRSGQNAPALSTRSWRPPWLRPSMDELDQSGGRSCRHPLCPRHALALRSDQSHCEATPEPGPTGLPAVSVTHYGEQNGDLMRDPEMCFELRQDALDCAVIGLLLPQRLHGHRAVVALYPQWTVCVSRNAPSRT